MKDMKMVNFRPISAPLHIEGPTISFTFKVVTNIIYTMSTTNVFIEVLKGFFIVKELFHNCVSNADGSGYTLCNRHNISEVSRQAFAAPASGHV